jgi:hypothetical protein
VPANLHADHLRYSGTAHVANSRPLEIVEV